MSHGSYDSNLGSEILILAGDIRSRSWPNIGGTYGTLSEMKNRKKKCHILDLLYNYQMMALIESYPSEIIFPKWLRYIRKIHIKKLNAISFSVLKFCFSEKATKICAIFLMVRTFTLSIYI
jgi:hypothetical protein